MVIVVVKVRVRELGSCNANEGPRSAFDGFVYFPRSAFGGFYLQMSLSHGYLLRIRINQVREVSIVY